MTFLSLNISDFNFLCENFNHLTPLEKSHPLFLSNPRLRVEVLSRSPFENFVGALHPPAPLSKKGSGVHIMALTHNLVFYWHSDLISPQEHTQHTQGPVD